MRKFIFLFSLCMLFFGIMTNAADKIIEFSKSPVSIQHFIKTHFAEQTVIRVEKERHEYKVLLQNSTEVEYNKQGEWTEVDMNNMALPQSVVILIPQNIRNYVEQNYVGRSIESVKKTRRGYEIDLVGKPDVELKFNKAGEFLRMDD